MSEKTTFEAWCIVELFGHQRIAGKCSEQNIAGVNMLRVDVPETAKQPAFTKLFGGAAIYAINPVDEVTATLTASELNAGPITSWQGETFSNKYLAEKAKGELPYSDDLPY
jgi:hypothetical protein